MDNDQNQEQQKSSVDRVNDLINKGRSTYNNLKGGKKGYNAIKTARVARVGATAAQGAATAAGGATATAGGTAAVGTSPAWIVPALIMLLISLLIILIVIIFGGAQNTNAGTPPTCTSISGTCQAAGTTCASPNAPDTTGATCSAAATPLCCAPPPPSDTITCTQDPATNPAYCLKEVYNVIVSGESNNNNLYTIYSIFASTKSDKYRQLLRTGGQTLYIYVPYCTGSCISLASTNSILLNGFFSLGLPYSSQQRLLIHESGHVICNRNGQLCNQFSNTTLASQDGTACYQYNSSNCTGSFRAGYFVKSYSLRYFCYNPPPGQCWEIDAHNESFAEAIAGYLFRSIGISGYRCQITISDYPSQCANTYEWVKTNIYGGTVL